MIGSTIGRYGVTGPTPSRRSATPWLIVLAAIVAAIAAAGCYLVAGVRAGVTVDEPDLAVAIVAFAVSQLARIPLRVGRAVVMLGWGDVGIVAVICLLPSAWVPAAVCAGALLGHGPRLFDADAVKRTRIAVAMASVTLGGAAATAVILASEAATPVRVDLQRPATVVPLLLAAPVYFLATSLLISSWIAGTTRGQVGDIWLRTLHGKRRMLVGNIAVALAVAVVIAVDVVWLAALAPVLLFLHRMYVRDLRTAVQKRTWAALADATRALSQMDERAVATAALRGAAELFFPQSVEIWLERPSGRQRRYSGRTRDLMYPSAAVIAPAGVVGSSAGMMDGSAGVVASSVGVIDSSAGVAASSAAVIDSSVDVVEAEAEPRPEGTSQVAVRQLVVGGKRIGELRLVFPGRPGGRSTLLVHEQHAFSTYAVAVASALHDASANRQLQAMAARGAYDAVHDGLTGLNNRSTLIARGNAWLSRAEAEDGVALVLLDINGLRAVNDALSYQAGDELLRVLAQRLADSQSEGELVGRLGGDEFTVVRIGPGATIGWARNRALELMALLAAPAEVVGVTIAMEASAGVVVEPADACDMAELLRRADVALHLAKRDGVRLVGYDPAGDAASTDRLALLAELRDALATTDQLMVYLQPTVDLVTGTPVGAEALVRWQHPRRGLLAPAEFIQPVEHSELAAEFTRHVLDLALDVAADWIAAVPPTAVSVNVCARCLLDPQFPELVAERLAAHDVPASRLIVEITEAVMGAELDVVATVVAGLRAIGVQVSVDDFGTESASLALLTGFAVDEVKIDRSFVAAMADSPQTAAIVRATVDLARQLGLRVVAQGVERPEQRAMLVLLGVHSGQGYLFAPPLRPAEATETLRGMLRHVDPPQVR